MVKRKVNNGYNRLMAEFFIVLLTAIMFFILITKQILPEILFSLKMMAFGSIIAFGFILIGRLTIRLLKIDIDAMIKQKKVEKR